MTVADAIRALQADPQDGDAFSALADYVERRTRRLVDRAQWREDIAGDVLLKLYERISLGTLNITDGAAGYVSTAIRNTFTDYLRVYYRDQAIAARARDEAAVARSVDPSPGAGLDDMRDILRKIYQHAHASRAARYQADFAQDWAQIRALVFEGIPLEQIICDTKGVARDSPSYRTAANAIYKRHSRFRESLSDAFDALASAGDLDAGEQELGRILLPQLVYCQQSRRRPVSVRGDGPADEERP